MFKVLRSTETMLLPDESWDSEVYVGMWKKSIRVNNYVVASKWKNRLIFTFFDNYFSARKFWETFTTRNAQGSSSHCPSTSDYQRSSSWATIKPVSRHYIRLINVARVPNVGQHQKNLRQKGENRTIFLFGCHNLIFTHTHINFGISALIWQ
jgi:hypothetical protein